MKKEALYTEAPDAGNGFRLQLLEEVEALIRSQQQQADIYRRRFFCPNFESHCAYIKSIEAYRLQLVEMLGWPLSQARPDEAPEVKASPVADDALGGISRVWIETLPGQNTYGLFFRPKGEGPFPLVIALHGGYGTPELCSGFFGSANYSDMTRRILSRGAAVFAPQLLLWEPGRYGPHFLQDRVDWRLKQLGGSLAALEVLRISRALDYFLGRDDISASQVGIVGLSFGGWYALLSAAIEPRIAVTLSSCFFNDRTYYDRGDGIWFDSAGRFLDPEMAAMVCPRALYIEAGRKDERFDVRRARVEAEKAAAYYNRLGIYERFSYTEHDGGHEFDRSDSGINFVCRHLGLD